MNLRFIRECPTRNSMGRLEWWKEGEGAVTSLGSSWEGQLRLSWLDLSIWYETMPRKVLQQEDVPIAEAKKILEKVGQEELGEFQRRTLDYVTKFAKISPAKAEKLISALTEKFQFERKDAIQIVNCMPSTVEEVRAILTVKGRVVASGQLGEVAKLVSEYKEK